jgi:amino acid adenylation domain-containing protein
MADVAPAFIPSVQGDWRLDASTSCQSSDNITQALRLHGSPNLAALRKSVESLLIRYQGLWNLTGETCDGSSDVLPIQDFSSLPIDRRESEACRYIHQQADGWFELTRGPLLRATLARLSASESILLISMHRSLSSAGVLINTVTAELSALYNAQVGGQSSPMSKPVAYQRALLDRGALAANDSSGSCTQTIESTAENTADNTAGSVGLPPDRPRFSHSGAVFGRESHRLPEALVASLREFSGAASVAPFTTLLAVFAALLSRHCGQRQFFIGVPLTNLDSGAQHGPPGFPALLPWRADLSGEPSFRQLAERVQRSSLQAAIQAQRPDGVPPDFHLFQVAIILEQPACEAVHLSGLGVLPYEMETRSAGLELVLHLEEHSAGLLITADYDAALFDPGTIQCFLGHYETLLGSAISDPEGSVSRLPALPEPERQQLLNEWSSAPAQEYPSDVALERLIEAQVEKTPDAVAVAFAPASCGQQRLTYAELNARANHLAAHLRSLGVTRNTLVGVCLERSIDLLIAPLAILKAGGAYLPLDPDHPDDHIGPIVENARLDILIGRPELAARLPAFRGKLVFLDWDALHRYPEANQPVAVASSDLAYVIYTSGSTGQPKGVMVPRRALNNLLWSLRDWYHFGPSDVLLAITTIAFDIAGLDLWLPLLAGARLVIVERATAMDAHLLQDAIHREGVTFLQCTPAFWKLLVDSGWHGKADLQAVCGGEAMPQDLARKLVPKVGRLWNMYGPTETTIWSTGYQFLGPDDPILIGRPIANTQVYILDEHLAPSPIGVPGELYIGGDGLADGYLHKPELTADRFVADPFSQRSEGRLYKTGDLARYRSDGNIECLGRNDDQIKLRGYRIEPEEIRAAITRHPAVRDAVAVLKTSATGDSRIVAYLISKTDHPPDVTELRSFLREKLPEYMVPATFVFLDSFPLNTNGKIDRRALPQPKIQSAASGESEAPADQIEARLKEIYGSVLGLSAIGVHDDFFDLGGHSLTAVQLFREINACFDLDLPLATLFHAPTVRRLAALIRDTGVGQMSAPLVPIQRRGSQPPVYCIGEVSGEVIVFRRLAQELGPDQPLYGLQPFCLLDALHTVEHLAAAYIEELRMTGESRPFCLLGYSFGGLVAVEMARQLQHKGIDTPLVVLIDSAYPAGCRANEPWAQRIRRFRYLSAGVRNGGGLQHLLERVKYGVTRIAHRASATVGVPLPANGAKDVTALQALAAESYRIKSYTGRVCLFRAESQQEFLAGGADLGWSGVLSNLAIEEVPGDHGTINTGSNLKILARKVRERLQDPVANGQRQRV